MKNKLNYVQELNLYIFLTSYTIQLTNHVSRTLITLSLIHVNTHVSFSSFMHQPCIYVT